MKVLLIFLALLIPTAGAFAKTSKPITLKRYTCLTSYMSNGGDAQEDRHVKYDPEFLRFRVQGKDVADIIEFIATYDVHESELPKDRALNPGGRCDYGKDRKGKVVVSKKGRPR